jgi:hypothetical protein
VRDQQAGQRAPSPNMYGASTSGPQLAAAGQATATGQGNAAAPGNAAAAAAASLADEAHVVGLELRHLQHRLRLQHLQRRQPAAGPRSDAKSAASSQGGTGEQEPARPHEQRVAGDIVQRRRVREGPEPKEATRQPAAGPGAAWRCLALQSPSWAAVQRRPGRRRSSMYLLVGQCRRCRSCRPNLASWCISRLPPRARRTASRPCSSGPPARAAAGGPARPAAAGRRRAGAARRSCGSCG